MLLKRIKQFGFYLSYELSLFQKLSLSLGLIMCATLLVFTTNGYFGKIGSASLISGSGASLRIEKVDTTQLSGSGTLIVSYAIKDAASGKYNLQLKVFNITKQEIASSSKESELTQDNITVIIPPAMQSAKTYFVEITTTINKQTLSDKTPVEILPTPTTSATPLPSPSVLPSSIPTALTPTAPSKPTPTPLPIQAPLPPRSTSSLPSTPPSTAPVLSPTPSLSCVKPGQSCQRNTDCCTNRCKTLKVSWMGKPDVNICLPSR